MVAVPPRSEARPPPRTSAPPGRAAPRQARAVATREAILDAAAHEFAAVGYQAASLSKILDRSGVTKGALYFHFASKEVMADAVVAVMEERIPEAVAAYGSLGGDVLTSVVRLAIGLADVVGNDVYCQGGTRVATEGALGPDRAAWPYRFFEEVFVDLLLRAEAEGVLRAEVDAKEFARTVVALGFGHRAVSTATSGLADLRERVVASWELLLGCVAAPVWLRRWNAAGGMASLPFGVPTTGVADAAPDPVP